jgi:hypothetical protein
MLQILQVLIVLTLSACAPIPSERRLRFVIEFSRHGARSPIHKTYDAAQWNTSGQLTAIGMRQHFLIGRELAYRYLGPGKLLNRQELDRQIVVRSTDYDRTIMSAQSQLYGLLYRTGQVFANDRTRWHAYLLHVYRF